MNVFLTKKIRTQFYLRLIKHHPVRRRKSIALNIPNLGITLTPTKGQKSSCAESPHAHCGDKSYLPALPGIEFQFLDQSALSLHTTQSDILVAENIRSTYVKKCDI